MAYDAIDNNEIEVDDAITQSLMQKIKDNFDFLFTASSGNELLQNPSFDTDADSSGEPDNWTVVDYAGGSHELDAPNAAHGAFALKFAHPGGGGNGGGYADSDFIPTNEFYQFKVAFLHKCSQSGVKVQIVVRYFSEAKIDLSADETIYSETTNPTTWSPEITGQATPPTAAQYMKIKVVGGFTDTDPGSSTNIWFDGMHIISDAWVKDRADTSVFNQNNVVFQDLDVNKDFLIELPRVGESSNLSYLQFSDDNGSTYDNIFIDSTSVSTSLVFVRSTSHEFVHSGGIYLKRQPDGSVVVSLDLICSSDGGVTGTSGRITVAHFATPINTFKIYSAGSQFNQAAATVRVFERNQ